MYLMIDNYDSFVYNLKAYFEELGREILVKRSDETTLDEIEDLKPEGIILSPGPKRPRDAALCVETVCRFQKRIPILGVLSWTSGTWILFRCYCGERGTAYAWKVTEVHHKGTGLFAGLPERFRVTRYHSLIVRQDTLPEDYEVDCISEDGAVMGISQKEHMLYGVQFHPEAVLTEYGHELLENFCKIAEGRE